MKTLKITSFTAAFLLLASAFLGGQAAADSNHKPGTMEHMHRLKEGKAEKMKDCHQMMTSLESLEEKVAAMKNTRGDEQVAAIASVVEELVAQNQIMHQSVICMDSCGERKVEVLPSEQEDGPLGSSLEAHVMYHY